MTGPGNFRELKQGSFIYALDQALDANTCQKMISRFEKHPEQQYIGRIGQNAELAKSVKQSTDLRISGNTAWADVDKELQQSLGLGLSLVAGLHPFFAANQFRDIGYNMQRTGKSDYYHWHVDSGPGEFSKRQLVAIWYLNEAPESGGETEFFHQKVSIKPKTGMLLLFPPFWTHLHRGTVVQNGVKYIATTWVCSD